MKTLLLSLFMALLALLFLQGIELIEDGLHNYQQERIKTFLYEKNK
jgi:Na+/phosphate symporter